MPSPWQRDGVALPSPSSLLLRRPYLGPQIEHLQRPCKGRSDPGCALLDMPLPPFSGYPYSPPACTCHAIRNHTRALYSVTVREGVFSEVRMPCSHLGVSSLK